MAGGKGSKGKKRPPARRPGSGGGGKAAAPAAPRPAASGGGEEAAPKPTRTERLDAARRARQRKAARNRAAVVGAVVLLVGAVAVVVAVSGKDSAAKRDKLTAGSCTFDTKADHLDAPPNNHVAPASYAVDPPAGGDHSLNAAGSGVFTEGDQAVPSDPEIVHALEHGYIAVWYKPGLSDEEVAAVREAYDKYPDDVLVVPRASLPGKAAATAWGKRLLCPDVEASALTEFVRQYRNKGPERVAHS